jgi:hypothetical protein
MFSIWHVMVLVLLLLPPVLVLMSGKVAGGAKVGWALLAFLSSWIGFAIFLIVSAGRPAQAKNG